MKDIKRAMRLVYVIIQVINLSYWLESKMEKNQISQFMFVMYMNLIIVYVYGEDVICLCVMASDMAYS